MRQLKWSVLLILVPVVGACGGDADGPSGEMKIVATTTILGDVVTQVLGDGDLVEVLMPIGVDPHDFSPSSQQVASINRADLVVANGLGLEEGLEDVLEAAAGDGVVVLYAGKLVTPLPEEGHEDHEEEGDHEHGGEDPHFWLDPVRMAEVAVEIGLALEDVDPSGDWSAAAASYAEMLMETDREVDETLGRIPADRRRLVTNHDSLDYFADRYEFEVVGVVIPGGSTLGDPSSEELAALVAVIEAETVPAIFAETTESDALAEAVVAEVGFDVSVVDLYTGSLGDEGSGAETYAGMLVVNADRIADALG